DVVVTEFGRVDVRGLAGEARAEALRSIAHPDHRAALA
ncbi:MAG: acetyl-CoA hydrolase/transferase C-terminal domain-containing protein, partial [Actinomycetes bacterium]